MANKKNQADEKNTIDELNESLTGVGTKIAENKKKIGGIITAVLVVAVAIIGFIFWNNRSNNDSAKNYGKIEQNAYKATMKAKEPSDSLFNVKLLAEYEKLIASDGSKAGANLARIAAAEKYYDNGKYQKTIDYLAKASIDEPVLAAQCKILTGDSYVGLNKLGEAMKCFDEAIAAGKDHPAIAVRAMLKKALVLDAQKKYGDALAVYKQIKKEYPQAMEEFSAMSNQGGAANAFSIDAYIAREEARMGK